jgi:hypothetical protein
MDHQERRISRIAKLASTNLTMALTMISIEAGLLVFVFTFYPREILKNGESMIPFPLFEGGPTLWISVRIITILHDIMISLTILLIVFSIFAFTFSFLYSHDALEMHAKATLRSGQIMQEDVRDVEKFYQRGLLGLKLGVSLLLGFILAVLLVVVYTFFTFFLLPTVLVLFYLFMYMCFLILLWLRPISRRSVKG